MPEGSVVLVSGGLDSSTVLFRMRRMWMEDSPAQSRHSVFGEAPPPPIALSILYGQRHKVELEAARVVADLCGVEHVVVDLSALLPCFAGSSQTDPTIDVPLGHYEEASMKATVVPNRNMVLLSVATAFAISRGCGIVVYGAHAGDHAIYPDCRPEFVFAQRRTMELCHYTPVKLYTPYIHHTKAFIAREAAELGVPIGKTYSCYEGGKVQCGRCSTCYERRIALREAGVMDPTVYKHPLPNYQAPLA